MAQSSDNPLAVRKVLDALSASGGIVVRHYLMTGSLPNMNQRGLMYLAIPAAAVLAELDFGILEMIFGKNVPGKASYDAAAIGGALYGLATGQSSLEQMGMSALAAVAGLVAGDYLVKLMSGSN